MSPSCRCPSHQRRRPGNPKVGINYFLLFLTKKLLLQSHWIWEGWRFCRERGMVKYCHCHCHHWPLAATVTTDLIKKQWPLFPYCSLFVILSHCHCDHWPLAVAATTDLLQPLSLITAFFLFSDPVVLVWQLVGKGNLSANQPADLQTSHGNYSHLYKVPFSNSFFKESVHFISSFLCWCSNLSSTSSFLHRKSDKAET